MSPWTPTIEAERVLLPLSDPDVGIVSREYMKLRDVDDIWGHSIGAHGTDSSLFFGVAGNAYNGGGSPDLASARLAAIGETVERYSAAYAPIDSDQVIYGSARDLRGRHDLLLAQDWELFAPEQYGSEGFACVPWTDDTELWWREGVDAATGTPVWTAAQMIHMAGHWRGEPIIGYSTSNGLACGISHAEATVSGIFEAVERDGFMLAWYNKLSLPLVDLESSPRLSQFVRRYIEPTGLTVSLVDLSAFCEIPAVLAVVRSPSSKLAPFAIGAAGAATIERACEKAATEAMYTRTWMKTEQREGRATHDLSRLNETVRSFEDHIRLYAGTPLIAEADFLTASTDRRPVQDFPRFDDSDPEVLRDHLVAHLTRRGHRVVTFDVTSPDIHQAGAAVVKSVITGLRPLDSMYAMRFLGGRRLTHHAADLGLVERPFERHELNPTPHPFP